MKLRLTAILLAALAAGALACSAVAGAAMVGIYRNGMESTTARAQLIKLSGRTCSRGGADNALRVALGKGTDACAFRTPVLGRNLEIAATERLLSGTPPAIQRKAYLGLELRAGGGGKYQMLVYPLQRKVQLVKASTRPTPCACAPSMSPAARKRARPSSSATSARPWSPKPPTPLPAN
jgi:hypothetical protein